MAAGRDHMMLRALRCSLVLLASCGGSVLIMRGGTDGEVKVKVDAKSHGGIHLVSLVRPFDEDHNHSGANARSVAQLTDGDWLVSIEAGASNIARLARTGATRWTRRGQFLATMEVGGSILGVGYLLDDAAPPVDAAYGGVRPSSIISIDARGRTRWSVTDELLVHVQYARLVRAAGTNVVVTPNAMIGVDDAGTVLWKAREPAWASAFEATTAGARLAIASSTSTITSTEVVAGIERRDVCVVRLVEPTSGVVHARVELAPEGHRCTVFGLAVVGDSLVVRVSDERLLHQDGKMWNEGVNRFIVLDARTLESGGSLAEATTRPTARPFTGVIGRDEITFLDAYASGQPLALAIFDAIRREVRYEQLLLTARVTIGDGFNSTIQLQSKQDLDQLVFAGMFAGHLRFGRERLSSDLHEIDGCAGQDDNDCTGVDTIAPFAGVIGAVKFTRR